MSEAYHRMEHLKGSSLGSTPALFINSRQGWKRLTRDKRSSLLRNFVNYGRKKCYNIDYRAQCYKTFYGNYLRIVVLNQSVCSWQAFSVQSNGLQLRLQPTRVKHLLGPPHQRTGGGRRGALPANIRLSWKGLPGTNNLAYNGNS